MKKTITLILLLAAMSCFAREQLIILNEGNWQSNNARISYFEDGRIVSNKWFEEKNGYGIGDTPNDIIQVGEDLIAIAVNWSNIIQYIRTDGTAVTATEDVPNNRKMATDGKYVYITSYAHECGTQNGLFECEKGYVAKVNLTTFKVEKCCEVGWEPEGIAYYNGFLFIADTGGYAFQEDHDYETTVSIVDASTMKLVKQVDTGIINLYGKMSQAGKYLCINSPGDYYDIPAHSVIFDCEQALTSDDCFYVLDVPATYNTATTDGKFFAIGSSFSYYTGEYIFNTVTIDPAKLFASKGKEGVVATLPGTVADDIKTKLASPYGIYVNPYTGYIYATDANGDFNSPGKLYQWTPDGKYIDNYKIYINAGHFLALGDWKSLGIEDVKYKATSNALYNLQGIRVDENYKGIIITNGKKSIK
ncbi:MAG: hypothetical protein Q4F34_05415 [Prevotellaceae bacterium]|nr:hypothetical protein [Prevotellaceae bacterium]